MEPAVGKTGRLLMLKLLLALWPITAHAEVIGVEFSAPAWCRPCQQMIPIVQKLKAEGLRIVVVDVDRNPALARAYGVSAYPTFMVIDQQNNGARIIAKTRGARSIAGLRKFLRSNGVIYSRSR